MPRNIPFYTVKERKPRHNQRIVFINRNSYQQIEEASLEVGRVSYYWEEVYDDGTPTGTCMPFSHKDANRPPPIGFVLRLQVDTMTFDFDDSKLRWLPEGEFFRRLGR